MAKSVSKDATIEKAYGNVLPAPIKFSYTVEELQEGEQPTADELSDYNKEETRRSIVNQWRTAAARSKAQNDALTSAGVQKPTLEDPNVRLATIVKALMAGDKDLSEEVAKQRAKAVLGM